MAIVEPVPNEPAAIAAVDGERALLVADYHAGVEAALRYERGVEVPSRAEDRRESILYLLELTEASRLVVLGDLMHSIGDPGGAERGELEVLFESLPTDVEVTLVKGNHDGAIETWLGVGADEPGGRNADSLGAGELPGGGDAKPADLEDTFGEPCGAFGEADETFGEADSRHRGGDHVGVSLAVTPGDGVRIGDVGVCHGHSWPSPDVLRADVVCMGHEHPCVRLEDEVGGSRVESAWLRGRLDLEWFRERPVYADASLPDPERAPEMVVVPAFNDLVGGTWVNVAGQSFLSPMLPGGLVEGQAYLLDGTRLGPYESI